MCLSVGQLVGPSVSQHFFSWKFLSVIAPAQPARLMQGSVSGLVIIQTPGSRLFKKKLEEKIIPAFHTNEDVELI